MADAYKKIFGEQNVAKYDPNKSQARSEWDINPDDKATNLQRFKEPKSNNNNNNDNNSNIISSNNNNNNIVIDDSSISNNNNNNNKNRSKHKSKNRTDDNSINIHMQGSSSSSAAAAAQKKQKKKKWHYKPKKPSGGQMLSVAANNNLNDVSEFLCTIKYRSRLPTIPLEPKFLKYPQEKDRFTKYMGTSLELNYPWKFHHESLMPIPLDLMDPIAYAPPIVSTDSKKSQEQHPEDEQILQLLDMRNLEMSQEDERNLLDAPFFVDSTYVTSSHEISRRTKPKKGINEQLMPNEMADKQRLVKEIKQTFKDVKMLEEKQKHPKKPNVHLVESLDVFPHDQLLLSKYTHVHFSHNPNTQSKKLSFMPRTKAKQAEMATYVIGHSILRESVDSNAIKEEKHETQDGDNDQNNEWENHWFSLYAPNDQSERNTRTRKEYEWVSEYTPVSRNFIDLQFLVFRNDEVYYAEYHDKLKLRHRPTDISGDPKASSILTAEEIKYFKQLPQHLYVDEPIAGEQDENMEDIRKNWDDTEKGDMAPAEG